MHTDLNYAVAIEHRNDLLRAAERRRHLPRQRRSLRTVVWRNLKPSLSRQTAPPVLCCA